jgi:aminopeptidase N
LTREEEKFDKTLEKGLKEFEKVSKKPVAKMMRNWTRKPGYPLVNVLEKGKKLRLTQARFFSSPLSVKQISEKTLWSINCE